MWMLKVRIRMYPKEMADHWNVMLTNHFFWECEKTLDFEHLLGAGQRKDSLKDYHKIWIGTILAYDEGLVHGDAVMAAAIWRQVWNGDENADPIKIALVTADVRRELARLAKLDDHVMARGYVGFGQPIAETEVLMSPAAFLRMQV